MKINRNKADAIWFDYDQDVKVKVRRLPFSQMKIDQDNKMDNAFQEFAYCLVDWEGLLDDEEKIFELTEENKKYLFDFYAPFVSFVKQKALEITIDIYEEIKN